MRLHRILAAFLSAAIALSSFPTNALAQALFAAPEAAPLGLAAPEPTALEDGSPSPLLSSRLEPEAEAYAPLSGLELRRAAPSAPTERGVAYGELRAAYLRLNRRSPTVEGTAVGLLPLEAAPSNPPARTGAVRRVAGYVASAPTAFGTSYYSAWRRAPSSLSWSVRSLFSNPEVGVGAKAAYAATLPFTVPVVGLVAKPAMNAMRSVSSSVSSTLKAVAEHDAAAVKMADFARRSLAAGKESFARRAAAFGALAAVAAVTALAASHAPWLSAKVGLGLVAAVEGVAALLALRKAEEPPRPKSPRAMRNALLAGSVILMLGAGLKSDMGTRRPVTTVEAELLPEGAAESAAEMLGSLMEFHPSWITRSVTSHDQTGDNDDGNGNGFEKEGDYRVLFHGKGEGRIERMWMTVPVEDIKADYRELWIVLDGKTAYRGSPVDFFEGRGPWKAPLVLDYEAASGAFLSYAPFPYQHEAKILFLGKPHYYQITYREGQGASSGPSADQLHEFLADPWWTRAPVPREHGRVELDKPLTLAEGSAVVNQLVVKASPADVGRLKLRIGAQAPVPLAFYFGGWGTVRSAIGYVDPGNGLLVSRLPIPLQGGEKLTLETEGPPVDVACSVDLKPGAPGGVHLVTQYREQHGPGLETTMPFFESSEPTQFVSLSEEITGGREQPPFYLEGDEMIRTDRMSYPYQLGTGTEDYFNSGWYFHGSHTNPLSGAPSILGSVTDNGVERNVPRHTLYRHHILDPIVGRSGLRFGFEAGDRGQYFPVTYRTLGLAYGFSSYKESSRLSVPLASVRTDRPAKEKDVESAVDAEKSQAPFKFRVRTFHGVSTLTLACPKDAEGLLLVRAYDASEGDQQAEVRLNGRAAGQYYEAYANPKRRFAEDSIWIPLTPKDHESGFFDIEIDSTKSPGSWTEAGYGAVFYSSSGAAPIFE